MIGIFTLAQTAPATTNQPVTLLELLVSGGWVMIPLAFVSLAAISLIIYYFMSIKMSAIFSQDLATQVDRFMENGDLKGLNLYLDSRSEAVSRVLSKALKFIEKHPEADAESIQAVSEAEGGRIAASLNQKVVYLLDIGSLAPMLGLFGTVVGILRSFGSIAMESSPMRTMLLAGGVSQALVATAAGLVVGITALFFYSFFRGRVQHLISVLETETTQVLQPLLLSRKK